MAWTASPNSNSINKLHLASGGNTGGLLLAGYVRQKRGAWSEAGTPHTQLQYIKRRSKLHAEPLEWRLSLHSCPQYSEF